MYSRRQLAIRMAVPLSGEQVDLLLCKIRVHHGKRDAVESTVPSSKERVFPRIRHGQDVINVQMFPLRVSDSFPARWRWRLGRISIGPLIPNELIILLAPHHTRESLALNVTQVITHWEGADAVVKVVRFVSALLDGVIEFLFIEICLAILAKSETNHYDQS